MKKVLLFALAVFASLSVIAKNNIKLKIEGPEKSYNMVRVTNQTGFSDFDLTVYFLQERDGKMVVSSALGNFVLKGTGDTDSVRVRAGSGQWIGVALPEGMEGVQAVLTYKDLPAFDIVQIVLIEGNSPDVGEEF